MGVENKMFFYVFFFYLRVEKFSEKAKKMSKNGGQLENLVKLAKTLVKPQKRGDKRAKKVTNEHFF